MCSSTLLLGSRCSHSAKPHAFVAGHGLSGVWKTHIYITLCCWVPGHRSWRGTGSLMIVVAAWLPRQF